MYYINLDYKTPTRFDLGKFMDFKEGAYDIVNSYLLDQVRSLESAGEYTILDCPRRPDMLSAAIYNGDTQYWYLLMAFNDSINFMDLKIGQKIQYFRLRDLEDLYFRLKAAGLGRKVSRL